MHHFTFQPHVWHLHMVGTPFSAKGVNSNCIHFSIFQLHVRKSRDSFREHRPQWIVERLNSLEGPSLCWASLFGSVFWTRCCNLGEYFPISIFYNCHELGVSDSPFSIKRFNRSACNPGVGSKLVAPDYCEVLCTSIIYKFSWSWSFFFKHLLDSWADFRLFSGWF